MARRTAADRLQQQLAEMAALAQAPDAPALHQALQKALQTAPSPVVARAARIIGQRQLSAHLPALCAAFARFCQDPVRSDPGCEAKAAIIRALDQLDHPDPAIFVQAAALRQMEPAWKEPVDTAVAVRAQAALALGRLYFEDVLLHLAEMLVDEVGVVRRAATESLLSRGGRDAAAVLALRTKTFEEDPIVLGEMYSALVRLAPQFGAQRMADLLEGGEEATQDLAAFALSESRTAEGLVVLKRWLEGQVRAPTRKRALQAIAAHRSEEAHAFLLDFIAQASTPEAQIAITALARQAFTPQSQQRLLTAASAHPADLSAWAQAQMAAAGEE